MLSIHQSKCRPVEQKVRIPPSRDDSNSPLYDCGTDQDTAAANNYSRAHLAARSYHPGGVNVGFADGSVRFAKNSVNITTWNALGTRAGGEVVSSDSY